MRPIRGRPGRGTSRFTSGAILIRPLLLALCSLFALTQVMGCATIEPPPLLHPGTAQMQRDRAENFDPFPLPELGPPTEARPRGFLLPQPDTERVQNAESYFERFHQSPPPGIYRAPRGMPAGAVPIAPLAPLYQSTSPVFSP